MKNTEVHDATKTQKNVHDKIDDITYGKDPIVIPFI